jgi:hypothetical protein
VRRVKPLLVALAAAVLATGGAGTWLAGAAAGYDLPVGPPAAAPGELVFAAGEELHVGARTYAVRPAPETMVATAGGLYYLADGVLYRWRDGPAGSARVAALGGIGWLSTTADGRYLAYVDHEHGPRNLGGHRIAETVVFDTTTGREVVRDAAGNGARTGTEDLSDLYGESTPTVLGFDDDAVYAQTARGGAVLRWDLDTGRRSALGPRERPVTENRPAGPLVDLDLVDGVPRERPGEGVGAYAGRRSPDGNRLAFTLGRGPLVSSSGHRRPVRLDVGGRQFVLAGWLDDDRFYGLALDRAPRPTAEVTVCSVPSGRCVAAGPRVPAEDGALPVFATGDFAY